jgi:TRAP-type C4-dicarboxylate transport system substrate-binding protein
MTSLSVRAGAMVALMTVGALLGGCSDDATNKAGGAADSITLRVGTDEHGTRPAIRQINEFARRVAALSKGRLTITPVPSAAGKGMPDWDQAVARKVIDGELEMGLIPTRAWDTHGVTSLRALNAPFLITSDELVAEVVSGELAPQLMSGLEKAGVLGLALFPESLRHPFAFDRPLKAPVDFKGQTIRMPTSSTTRSFFAALGATPTDATIDVQRQAGMESSYASDTVGTATGNVTFWPKINTLVINDDAMADLDAGHRKILADAAGATRSWAIDAMPTDGEAARAYCERGVVVAASGADIAALEQAAEPVYADLEREAQTKSLIASIRSLKARASAPATAVECGDGARTLRSQPGPGPSGGSSTGVEGVFRFEFTREDLVEAGSPDENHIRENVGVYTWTNRDGRWCAKTVGPYPIRNPTECGTYTVDGDLLTLTFSTGDVEAYRWKLVDDGDLQLALTDQHYPEPVAFIYVKRPWQRISDAP